MQDVVVRIVRSDGEELSVGSGTDWRIPSDGLENWANLPYEVEVAQNAYHDGGIVMKKRIGSVDRTITAEAADSSASAVLRERIVKFFNSKHSFTAHLTYQGRTRWCSGEQIGFACDAGNVHKPVRFSWTVLCPVPYLMSESDFGKDIARIEPMLVFPFVSPVDEGFAWSAFSFAKNVSIDNTGDVETPFAVEIKALGQVVNPKIINGDKYIRIVDTLEKGDVLTVDMQSMPPRIRKNGANVINKADRMSSFTGMSFAVGDNTVSYSADRGDNNMSVSLRYNERYIGI